MSTRGCIARLRKRTPLEYVGVYCHLDSYPVGLGRSLFRMRNGLFGGDTEAMLRLLVDANPHGWEVMWGFARPTYKEQWASRPGDDQITQDNDPGEFSYIFTASVMIVKHGSDGVIAEVDLDGPEPDWVTMTRKAGGWDDYKPYDRYEMHDGWHMWCNNKGFCNPVPQTDNQKGE